LPKVLLDKPSRVGTLKDGAGIIEQRGRGGWCGQGVALACVLMQFSVEQQKEQGECEAGKKGSPGGGSLHVVEAKGGEGAIGTLNPTFVGIFAASEMPSLGAWCGMSDVHGVTLRGVVSNRLVGRMWLSFWRLLDIHFDSWWVPGTLNLEEQGSVTSLLSSWAWASCGPV